MKLQLGFAVCVVLALAVAAPAQSGQNRVAVVNGKDVTQQELEKAAEAELKSLETRRQQQEAALAQEKQEILAKALETLIGDKLIEAEAAKLKRTKEELIEIEIESNVSAPSEAEIESFYETYKDRINVPKAQALPQVKQYLTDRSRQQYRDMLLNRLRRDYAVKSYLEPLRAKVSTEGFPSKGPANAPVTIVEFSDFECPYCGGLYPTLKQVEKTYAQQVRIVYRQFPLTNIHPYAQKAAEASLCANDQKKFWEFHDSLFENQRELSIADLKQRAVDLKLDAQTFNQCLDSGRHAATIQADVQEGARNGISGTPALFINGRLLSGNQPYAEIRDVIEDELQRKGVK